MSIDYTPVSSPASECYEIEKTTQAEQNTYNTVYWPESIYDELNSKEW